MKTEDVEIVQTGNSMIVKPEDVDIVIYKPHHHVPNILRRLNHPTPERLTVIAYKDVNMERSKDDPARTDHAITMTKIVSLAHMMLLGDVLGAPLAIFDRLAKEYWISGGRHTFFAGPKAFPNAKQFMAHVVEENDPIVLAQLSLEPDAGQTGISEEIKLANAIKLFHNGTYKSFEEASYMLGISANKLSTWKLSQDEYARLVDIGLQRGKADLLSRGVLEALHRSTCNAANRLLIVNLILDQRWSVVIVRRLIAKLMNTPHADHGKVIVDFGKEQAPYTQYTKPIEGRIKGLGTTVGARPAKNKTAPKGKKEPATRGKVFRDFEETSVKFAKLLNDRSGVDSGLQLTPADVRKFTPIAAAIIKNLARFFPGAIAQATASAESEAKA
jgi:hypothetical protein